MPVIGTAGHVDHGKSTLVRILTGRDPDRWELEKQRGLTIDLGFAWATLPSGILVGFVDVPGHDRYARNMLAGISGIDLALLVVAADEGWKAQTEEHLAILDLLGIDKGVVAVTKTDTADAELVELQVEDVRERLDGSTLHDAPVVTVSALRGEGMEGLAAVLAEVAAGVDVRDVGRPRLWVDRAFTIKGAGSVVTGTLRDGTLGVEDHVVVYPLGVHARIRGIEAYENARTSVGPGCRVALNLTPVKRAQLDRGVMIGLEGQWEPTSRFSATLRPARYQATIPNRGAYQVHIGSRVTTTRLRILAEDETGTVAVLDLADPVCVSTGERFILRDVGRRHIVGGGRVLDPDPPRRRNQILGQSARLAGFLDGSADDVANRLLGVRGRDSGRRLEAHSGGGIPTDGIETGDGYLSPEEVEQALRLIRALTSADASGPASALGIPVSELAHRIRISPSTVRHLIGTTPDLTECLGVITTARRAAAYRPDDDPRWRGARARLDAEWPAVPTLADLDLPPDLIKALLASRDLVRVANNLAYLPAQLRAIIATLESMGGSFTVGEFCERLGISRRYGVPILEWADKHGHTRRHGDHRQATHKGTRVEPG